MLSLAPDVKTEYETVYGRKSNAIEMRKIRYGYSLVDEDGLESYDNLTERLAKLRIPNFFKIKYSGKSMNFYNLPPNVPVIRSLSGKEFLQLPLNKQNKDLCLPEMSNHYLIMYLLGMASRYYPKEWGKITEGKTSGDIYVVKKFLEVTERKFPNFILNALWSREFIFISPTLKEEQTISDKELERVWEYVKEKTSDEWRHLV